MSNNSFAEIETFVMVSETGSFTRAAERLGRSKAGVSRQVKNLEQRLGARLLNRTTRSLSLTEAGRALYQRAAAALADLHDAEESVGSLHSTPHGRLRISLPVDYGHKVVAPVLFALASEFAGLELDISFSDRYVDLAGEGFDLAVRIGHLADSSLIARRLGQVQLMVCASPRYLTQKGSPQRPSQLVQHDCLLYTHQTSGPSWRFADGETVSVRGRVRADSGSALRLAAIAGFGIATLPDFYVLDDFAAGQLVPLLEGFQEAPMGVWAVYPHRRHLSQKVRMTVDRLVLAIEGSDQAATGSSM